MTDGDDHGDGEGVFVGCLTVLILAGVFAGLLWLAMYR